MASALSLFLWSTLLRAVAGQSPADPSGLKDFNFRDYFQGEWTVNKAAGFMASSEYALDTSVVAKYVIEAENNTQNLLGTYEEKDSASGENTLSFNLLLEFEEGNSNRGEFKTGEEAVSLFEFDFHQLPNGMVYSAGRWFGSSEGWYHISIASHDRFTITVTPGELNAEEEVQIWSMKRIPKVVEQTFFEKYRTLIMMGGMLCFNLFVQKKTREIAPAPGPAPGTGGASSDGGVTTHSAGKPKQK